MRFSKTFFIFSIVLVAAAVFTATIVHALFYDPHPEVLGPEIAVPTAQQTQLETAMVQPPARLRIPSIEVDAAVQHVGVNAKGNMARPSNFKDVAWYKYGPSPRANGSAVIAGHLDNGLGLPAVFSRLREVRPGDAVIVEADDGTEQRFIVKNVQSYPYKEVPTSMVFSPNGPAGLNLITCDGNWIAKEKTYDKRLVVFAERVM